MRAVSSPSLSDSPLDINDLASPFASELINGTHDVVVENVHQQMTQSNGQPTGSVLQKLKNTFTHLKSKTGNASAVSATTSTLDQSNESATYRFGPLLWRSSKERRKTKNQRRDKCNSSDSGIQVELEFNDNTQGLDRHYSSSSTYQVRRANSAKVSGVSATAFKTNIPRCKETFGFAMHSKPVRSLSQPSGLNRGPIY